LCLRTRYYLKQGSFWNPPGSVPAVQASCFMVRVDMLYSSLGYER